MGYRPSATSSVGRRACFCVALSKRRYESADKLEWSDANCLASQDHINRSLAMSYATLGELNGGNINEIVKI